jgi:hypothetical protein
MEKSNKIFNFENRSNIAELAWRGNLLTLFGHWIHCDRRIFIQSGDFTHNTAPEM